MLKKGEKCPSQHQIITPKTEIHIEMEHRKTADYLGRLQLDFDIYNDVFFYLITSKLYIYSAVKT